MYIVKRGYFVFIIGGNLEKVYTKKIEETVKEVLSEGFATQDIASENSKIVSTSDMGDLIIENLK